MIILGIILVVLGFVLGMNILTTIGAVLVVVGAIFWILGATGRAVGAEKSGTSSVADRPRSAPPLSSLVGQCASWPRPLCWVRV